jgi:hypothetical protein
VLEFSTDVFIDELARLVVAKVQAVDGVARTLNCPVIHF